MRSRDHRSTNSVISGYICIKCPTEKQCLCGYGYCVKPLDITVWLASNRKLIPIIHTPPPTPSLICYHCKEYDKIPISGDYLQMVKTYSGWSALTQPYCQPFCHEAQPCNCSECGDLSLSHSQHGDLRRLDQTGLNCPDINYMAIW